MSYQDIEDLLPLAFFPDRVKPGSSFAQHNTVFGCLPIVGQSQDYAPLAKRIGVVHSSPSPSPASRLSLLARLNLGSFSIKTSPVDPADYPNPAQALI
ncbi:hypothetical protein JCM11641_004886, partial [Rhodosporidiobolus odoratus]